MNDEYVFVHILGVFILNFQKITNKIWIKKREVMKDKIKVIFTVVVIMKLSCRETKFEVE